MNKKLETEQKLEITLFRTKSLRALAKKYGVHHSTIAEIFKESEDILRDYWTLKSKRKGRPSKVLDTKAVDFTQADQEKASLQKECDLKQMRIDYLELKLKWEHERALEAQQKSKKQFKKKKK